MRENELAGSRKTLDQIMSGLELPSIINAREASTNATNIASQIAQTKSPYEIAKLMADTNRLIQSGNLNEAQANEINSMLQSKLQDAEVRREFTKAQTDYYRELGDQYTDVTYGGQTFRTTGSDALRFIQGMQKNRIDSNKLNQKIASDGVEAAFKLDKNIADAEARLTGDPNGKTAEADANLVNKYSGQGYMYMWTRRGKNGYERVALPSINVEGQRVQLTPSVISQLAESEGLTIEKYMFTNPTLKKWMDQLGLTIDDIKRD